jgi:hypothetical protein
MKVQVTNLNVTKIHEDVLLNIINTLHEGSDLYILIDSELERRAALVAATKLNVISQNRKLIELKAEIQGLLETLKIGKMSLLVTKLGSEFEDDYELNFTNFSIKSNAQSFNPNVNNYWEYENTDRMMIHFRNLIYYRIYDHYMRYPSEDAVTTLAKLLVDNE